MNWNVYKYVQDYFQTNFPEYYLMTKEQKKTFTVVVDKLLASGYSVGSIRNGEYDDEIARILNEYVNSYFTSEKRKDCLRLCEYVYELIRGSGNNKFKLECSDDILDHIVKQVVAKLFSRYYEARLDTEDFEKLVVSTYNEIYDEIFKELKIRSQLYLNKTMDFYFEDINYDDILVHVVSRLLRECDRDFLTKLFESKTSNSKVKLDFEKKISEYADRYIASNKKKLPDPTEYISSFINDNYINLTDDMLYDAAKAVEEKLKNAGHLRKEIVSGKLDEEIDKLTAGYFAYRQRMKKIQASARENAIRNSVKRDDCPPRVKAKKGTMMVTKPLITLVLVATILGLSVNGIYDMATDIHNHNVKKNVAMIDDYGYSNINTIHTDAFDPTVDNIISSFDDYSQFDNNNFKYLGFYQAYRSVKEDRLYIMDNMLSQIRFTVRLDDKYADLADAVVYNSCYLDFMYDRLYEMGFEEIKDSKYTDLLNEYVAQRNAHPYEDAVKYLSSSQQKLLEKVRDKYIEYSEKYLVELGELLGSEEYADGLGLSGGHSL